MADEKDYIDVWPVRTYQEFMENKASLREFYMGLASLIGIEPLKNVVRAIATIDELWKARVIDGEEDPTERRMTYITDDRWEIAHETVKKIINDSLQIKAVNEAIGYKGMKSLVWSSHYTHYLLVAVANQIIDDEDRSESIEMYAEYKAEGKQKVIAAVQQKELNP